MEPVSLPPEEDIYIPTIESAQSAQDNQDSLSQASAVQLPTIRYTPVVAPPLVASRTVVADAIQSSPILQGIQYRTTFCTQVQFAHTTFHYPPTPPVEGSAAEPDKLHPSSEILAIQQGVINQDPGLEKVNPFPSLPTPPDIHAEPIPSSSILPSTSSMAAAADAKAVLANPWHQPANGTSFLPFSQGAFPVRGHHPPLQPTLYSPAMADCRSNAVAMCKKVPPLVKDGEVYQCVGELIVSCVQYPVCIVHEKLIRLFLQRQSLSPRACFVDSVLVVTRYSQSVIIRVKY